MIQKAYNRGVDFAHQVRRRNESWSRLLVAQLFLGSHAIRLLRLESFINLKKVTIYHTYYGA